MDGSTGFQAQWVVRYVEQLRQTLADMEVDVEVVFWDERLTTEQAREIMSATGRSNQSQKGRLDAVAAAAILQSYLDR
jgi:putative Holliday junction resolvase